MGTYGNPYVSVVFRGEAMAWKVPTKRIDLNKEYTPAEAVALLGVTAETIKAYCRDNTLDGAYRVGPRKEWRVPGRSIQELRDKWEKGGDE